MSHPFTALRSTYNYRLPVAERGRFSPPNDNIMQSRWKHPDAACLGMTEGEELVSPNSSRLHVDNTMLSKLSNPDSIFSLLLSALSLTYLYEETNIMQGYLI